MVLVVLSSVVLVEVAVVVTATMYAVGVAVTEPVPVTMADDGL